MEELVQEPPPRLPPSSRRPVLPGTLLVVVGPTAAGKSELALRLAEALDGDIVSCDALQLRAGLPILTAKPPPDELRRVPHHLVGVLPQSGAATAAQYTRLADAVLERLSLTGRPAVLCGGTGLYLRALCEGLFEGPPADGSLRVTLREQAARDGVAALHRRLAAVDPTAAGRIAPADYVRIERALEVHTLTGRPLSDWLAEHQAERLRGPRYHTLRVAVDPGPDALRARIAVRVGRMLDAGLLDEVAAVRATGTLSDPPLGYDLVCRHLDGMLTLPEMSQALAQQTAQYARRQRTWFRREPEVAWYSGPDAVPIAELVAAIRRSR